MKFNNKISLNSDWQFALANSTKELLVANKINVKLDEFYKANVPGTIHTDLLNNQLIDEPFYSDNEKKLGWIADCDWVYQKEFVIDKSTIDEYQLVFDGLDTISEIYLNDILISKTNNMFVKYKYDVTSQLENGKNIIKVLFKSPSKFSEYEESKYVKLPVALNSSRVYIRKAQYSFGWDWGPIFTTSGIWKDVYLEKTKKSEIEKFTFNTISIGDDIAQVEIKSSINNEVNNKIDLLIKLELGDSVVENRIYNCTIEETIRINIPTPKLWFPNGEGEQNLYNLSLRLIDAKGELLDELVKKVGIRIIELVKETEGDANFAFKVNDKMIFCKGSNWIPADTFLTRVTDVKYFDLLNKAKNANMNMIRVWGGGIYENDIFYEYCDQLGLLVWQDFMFACASYPEHEEFIKNVEVEVSQNVFRLQHHASLAIWCGNNENEWIWHQEQKKSISQMSGYKIFNEVIPRIIKNIDEYSNYWQSSPFGDDLDPNSRSSGNTHQWELWSRWLDYTEVKNDDSLFVTEFGFQGPANINTWKKALPKKNRKVQDEIFEFHNKQVEGPERIFKFLSSHLPIKTKWRDYLYLTQLNQGLALKTCLEHWRLNNRTNGSIIWQLNDCWPVTSWSLIDSESDPKLAYHFVKNAFNQKAVSIKNNNECTVSNQAAMDFIGKLKISYISVLSGEIEEEKTYNLNITDNSIQNISISTHSKSELFLIASIYNEKGNLVHRNYFSEKKLKHLKLPKSNLKYSLENDHVKISSESVALFIDLYHPKLTFSDRGFILLPNEDYKVAYLSNGESKINTKKLQSFCLNEYLRD